MLFFVFDWNSIRFAKFIVACCLIVVHLSESDLLVYPTLGRCFVRAIYMFKSPRRLQGRAQFLACHVFVRHPPISPCDQQGFTSPS